MTDQLTLAVGLRDGASFDNFYAPSSAHVVSAVRGLSGARSSSAVFIFGDSGCGKTHLGWAACREARENTGAALYIPMRQGDMARALLAEPPDDALVCIDDLESVAGDRSYDGLLFRFVEQLSHASRLRILFTATCAPRHLGMTLPDLVSRLSAAPGYPLESLTDIEKAQALQLRAQARGLQLGLDVVEYVMRHYSRDTHALFTLLEKIDNYTLASQRRITLPLVRDLLAER